MAIKHPIFFCWDYLVLLHALFYFFLEYLEVHFCYLKNIASLNAFHLTVVGRNGGAIDDDIIICRASHTDYFPIEGESIRLSILALDVDADSGHDLWTGRISGAAGIQPG